MVTTDESILPENKSRAKDRHANRDQNTVELIFTLYAFKEDEQKSLDAGCTGHMTKPIKKAKLPAAPAAYAAAET